MTKRPEIEAARSRRLASRKALRLIREAWQTRETPVLIDVATARRAVTLAALILEGRCKLTGEDPAEVLAELEASL